MANEETHADIAIGVGVVLLSGFMLWATALINPSINPSFFDNAFWPRAITVLLIALGMMVAGRSVWKLRRRDAARAAREDRSTTSDGESPNLGKLSLATALCAGYAIIVYPLGFVASTPLYVVSFMYMLGERHLLRMVALALVLDVLFVVLFGQIIAMPLPRGFGVLRELSFRLY